MVDLVAVFMVLVGDGYWLMDVGYWVNVEDEFGSALGRLLGSGVRGQE